MNIEQMLMDAINDEGEEIRACLGHEFTRERQEGGFICAHCPKIQVTQPMIDENLNNANENGCEYHTETVENITLELMAYSCDCETATAEELRPFVEDWKRRVTQ